MNRSLDITPGSLWKVKALECPMYEMDPEAWLTRNTWNGKRRCNVDEGSIIMILEVKTTTNSGEDDRTSFKILHGEIAGWILSYSSVENTLKSWGGKYFEQIS